MIALAPMRENLVMAAVILACATAYVLWSARRQPGRGGRRRTWLPVVALLAGPGVTLFGWAADVVLNPPVVMSDSWALLPPMLVIGTFVGVVSSVVFALTLRLAQITLTQNEQGPRP